MTRRKVTTAEMVIYVFIIATLVTGMWLPSSTKQAGAKDQPSPPEGPTLIGKGCQMISDALKAFNESKDAAATRKLMKESCSVLSRGRELVMQDQKLMMSSERLGVGLEMMVSGCRMISYGLKKIEQKTDEAEGKKLVTEGNNMVTDGKKLFDEGMAKAAKNQ